MTQDILYITCHYVMYAVYMVLTYALLILSPGVRTAVAV